MCAPLAVGAQPMPALRARTSGAGQARGVCTRGVHPGMAWRWRLSVCGLLGGGGAGRSGRWKRDQQRHWKEGGVAGCARGQRGLQAAEDRPRAAARLPRLHTKRNGPTATNSRLTTSHVYTRCGLHDTWTIGYQNSGSFIRKPSSIHLHKAPYRQHQSEREARNGNKLFMYLDPTKRGSTAARGSAGHH